MANVISWRSVTHVSVSGHNFSFFSFQSHWPLFSHVPEMRGDKSPGRKFALNWAPDLQPPGQELIGRAYFLDKGGHRSIWRYFRSMLLNPIPPNPDFIRPWRRNILKTLWVGFAFNSISVISRRQVTLFMSFLGFISTRLGLWSVLLKDTPTKNPKDPMRLDPRTPELRVKHFTTNPRRTLINIIWKGNNASD